MGVHRPYKIQVLLSKDGKRFNEAASKSYDSSEVFAKGIFREDVSFVVKAKARYVRVLMKSPGKCPAGHVRPGQDAKVYVDEIMVE